MNLHALANPARFTRLADALLPWLAGATVLLSALGLVYGLVLSPPDYQQHDTVRIMYVHVPAAWLGMSVYAIIAVASAVALVWRHPLADVAAKEAAPVGAAFTGIALVTGSLWGQPTWGTWWVWDARLTSVLILFLVYLGYMALWEAFDDRQRAARSAAILALVGAVNLPIVKYSVDWWNTLHQPSSFSITRMGSAIDPSMLTPLLLMTGAAHALFLWIWFVRIKAELAERRLAVLQARRAAGGRARRPRV